MSRLVIRLFGSPEIELAGKPVETDRRKAVALLAYLAVTGVPQSRDALAALFWPDFDSSRAYAYLRRTLWELGHALGEGIIAAERDLVRLDPQADAWVDVSAFQELSQPSAAGDLAVRLAEAAALYRGDFMAGFSLRDSPAFDEWQLEQSESLRRQLAEGLALLSRTCAGQGEADAAVAHARRWLALDTLNEEAHRWLMELYARTGQRSAAVRQYETCARLLDEELGVQPEKATLALYERVRSGELRPAAAPGEVVAEALAAPEHSAAPLPVSPTSPPVVSPGTVFVGREKELAEISGLLADGECRLLTLLGPGGIGKTRLALQASRDLADMFSDGACFVPLAPVADAQLVPAAIASTLHLRFRLRRGDEPEQTQLEQMLDFLREKDLLLVLDNFEHLIPAAELVSQLLAAAPRVKVLATSRERLNLPEEWALTIQGMAYPDEDQAGLQEQYSALKLFLQVARQVQVGFEPSEADLRAAGRICRWLDGMPLGIELAASWVRVLSAPEIAAEIEGNLDFLTTSKHGMPERHRSLRAVFEHSWELLSESERAVFRKLSIFRAGFTREAAAQVAGASLGLLSALVDKSLVRRSPDGRYDLHEVLKRYAAEKLEELPQQMAEVRDAFYHYYLAMLQDLADTLKGSAQKEGLRRREVENDNLRAAWYMIVEAGDLKELEQCLLSAEVIYFFGMRFREAAELVEFLLKKLRLRQSTSLQNPTYRAVLALALGLLSQYLAHGFERTEAMTAYYRETMDLLPSLPDGVTKANVLLITGFGARILPREEMMALARTCIQMFKQAGDLWSASMAMVTAADTMQIELGHIQEMRDLILEAMSICRSLGNRWSLAVCYQMLSLTQYWTGQYDDAVRDGLEARAIYLEFNERWRAMDMLVQLGRIETDRGHFAEARRYFQETLQFCEEMGARYFAAVNQDCLAYVELLEGNLELAQEYDQRSLAIYRQLGYQHGIGMALGNLGDVAMAQGDYEKARQYFTESLAVLERLAIGWMVSISKKKLGHLALLTGNYAESEAYLSQALKLSQEVERAPDVQEAQYLLGWLRLKTGKIQDARQLLEGVIAHPATTPPVRAKAEDLLASI
jgi:predicted ATPase/DNA-binding SARP family transcriptional activator